ncbi:hypothetical protein [Sphingomonas leidyi]|uniref:hypothetical protein n=1 Tax=Sphingomonas leidyi TaxID=68569 RepID=UPI0036D2FBF3
MATQLQPLTISQQLEGIAREVHDLVFDFMEPARSIREADDRIARVEDIADRMRAAVRGRTS